MPGLDTAMTAVGIASGGVVVVGAVVAGARAVWRSLAATVRVRDAILGVPATATEDAKPGLVEQVRALRREQRTEMGEVRREVGEVRELLTEHLTWHHNSGAPDPTATVRLSRRHQIPAKNDRGGV